ncbi:hypothetical protein VNO78_31712 [Psophocarpus tetragonolobus]|uniref:Uncharacterized protein n=1 Tax=Psophocarpus tetragonolobus TaxID=3891 RepID=A0AAN9RYJ3_PSOTE
MHFTFFLIFFLLTSTTILHHYFYSDPSQFCPHCIVLFSYHAFLLIVSLLNFNESPPGTFVSPLPPGYENWFEKNYSILVVNTAPASLHGKSADETESLPGTKVELIKIVEKVAMDSLSDEEKQDKYRSVISAE